MDNLINQAINSIPLQPGEHLISLMLTETGQPDYWLIEVPMPDEAMTWHQFNDWATLLGYRPASEREGRLMAANPYAGLPTSGAFWLAEHDSYSDYAYIQNFSHGNQRYYYKNNKYRARAVRRLKI